MAVEIVDSCDIRLTEFIGERKSESFLLHTLQEIPTELRVVAIDRKQHISGLVSTNAGTITAQMPNGFDEALLAEAFRTAQTLNQVSRFVCHYKYASPARHFFESIGFETEEADIATLFKLDLAKLPNVPLREGVVVRPANMKDAEFLTTWLMSSLSSPSEEDTAYLKQLAIRRCSGDQEFWVLEQNGVPVSVGGISERTERSVKVAGILTKKEFRGEGYAPCLISSFLEAAQQIDSPDTAVLLALTETAKGCYDRMGFKRIGDFTTLNLHRL